MKKYIYVDNYIYETEKFNESCIDEDLDCYVLRDDSKLYVQRYLIEPNWTDENKYDFIEYNNYRLFDEFEELIEVGDLIKIPYFNGCHKCPATLVEVDDFNYDLGWCHARGCCFSSSDIEELWKLTDDAFTRVCHKKEDKWVID